MLSLGILIMDSLCLYLLDLIQNSIAAKSSYIKLFIHEGDMLHVMIKDNGIGMSSETLKQAVSPFYTQRKTRRVGLGLPMIKWLCEQVDGTFYITSEEGKGTELNLILNQHHIDMPAFGDYGELLYLISINQDVIDFEAIYQINQKTYTYHLKEIKEILGISLTSYHVMKTLIASINTEIERLRGDV